MGFKRIDYDLGEEVFEVIIRDSSGIISKWKTMKSDFGNVVKILNKKFDLGLIIKDRKVSDLDWIP